MVSYILLVLLLVSNCSGRAKNVLLKTYRLLPLLRKLCSHSCLFVGGFMQKLLNRFPANLDGGWTQILINGRMHDVFFSAPVGKKV